MIKERPDKNDKDLVYKKFICDACNKELFRTVENIHSNYGSPTFIVHCKGCGVKYYVKYNGSYEIDFGVFITNY